MWSTGLPNRSIIRTHSKRQHVHKDSLVDYIFASVMRAVHELIAREVRRGKLTRRAVIRTSIPELRSSERRATVGDPPESSKYARFTSILPYAKAAFLIFSAMP